MLSASHNNAFIFNFDNFDEKNAEDIEKQAINAAKDYAKEESHEKLKNAAALVNQSLKLDNESSSGINRQCLQSLSKQLDQCIARNVLAHINSYNKSIEY